MVKVTRWIVALGLLFTITSQAWSETRWVTFNFFRNNGGLNDGFSDTDIEDNEASGGQNFVFTTGGSIQKRKGFSKVTTPVSASGVITGVHFYKKSDGNSFLFITADNEIFSKVDYASGGGLEASGIITVGGSPTINITQNDLADFTVAEDILVVEDGIGTTPPFKYDGTTFTSLSGSPPNATMVAYHKLHLFLAGNSALPSRLYASNLGDIQTWTSTDTIDIETNDGSIIRDVEPGLDALYIWKDKSIWRLSGTDRDNFILERMVDGIGTLSRRSVAKLRNNFLFVTNQGDIALYDGGINVEIISQKVQGSIDEASFARFKYSPGVVFDDDYYIAYTPSGGGQHTRLLVFDSFHKAWTKFTGINANALAVAEDSSGKEVLVFGDYNGFVSKYPSGDSDDGGGIDFAWVSKNFNFPEVQSVGGGIEKVWRLTRTFVESEGNYGLSIETRSDFEATGQIATLNLLGDQPLWGTAVYGTDLYGVDEVIVGRTETNKIKDFFQIKYSNPNASEPITIRGYQMAIEPTSRI